MFKNDSKIITFNPKNVLVDQQTLLQQQTDDDFDGDPMSFVRRFQFEKENLEGIQHPDPLIPNASDKIVVPKTTKMPENPTIQTLSTFEPKSETQRSEPSMTTTSIPETIKPSTVSLRTTEQTTTMPSTTTKEYVFD